MDSVKNFYDRDSEYEWSRNERHPIEFALTYRALYEWLNTLRGCRGSEGHPIRICDVGGGPGHYAIRLANAGYRVTLLDLSVTLVDRAREEAQRANVQLEEIAQGNALDLTKFKNESFDAVLLMGPLYHLLSKEDRVQAVREAHRILRTGGLLFTAYIGRYGSIRYTLANCPEIIIRDPRLYALEMEALSTGRYTPEVGEGGFTDAYFAHPNEVSPFIEELGFRSLDILSCEGFASHMEERFKALTASERGPWLDILYKFCRDPSLLGAAGHILHVGLRWD